MSWSSRILRTKLLRFRLEKAHLVLKLNEESQKIIELLHKDMSVEDISAEIKKEYSVEDGQLREYITDFIGQLKEYDLIEG